MRLRRSLLALAAGAALTAGLGGGTPAQANHCGPVLIFSSTKGGPALNAGAGGCVLDDEDAGTNYLFPLADSISVGSTATPTGPATVDIDGTVVTVPLAKATATSTRWDSPKIAVNNPRVVTASVPTATGVTVTVTYYASV